MSDLAKAIIGETHASGPSGWKKKIQPGASPIFRSLAQELNLRGSPMGGHNATGKIRVLGSKWRITLNSRYGREWVGAELIHSGLVRFGMHLDVDQITRPEFAAEHVRGAIDYIVSTIRNNPDNMNFNHLPFLAKKRGWTPV